MVKNRSKNRLLSHFGLRSIFDIFLTIKKSKNVENDENPKIKLLIRAIWIVTECIIDGMKEVK